MAAEKKEVTCHEFRSGSPKEFLDYCEKKGVDPTDRQVSKFRRKPAVLGTIPDNETLHRVFYSVVPSDFMPRPKERK